MTRNREYVLSSWIDRVSWSEVTETILNWAKRREHRIVCICNVHSVATARSDASLRNAIDTADIATPDGMPIAWLISRRLGIEQARVNGPDLTLRLCGDAADRGIAVAFYGSDPPTLSRLRAVLAAKFSGLQIATAISPPFRALTEAEITNFTRQLNDSQAGIIFVGLGCPKQELWMAENKDRVSGVLIGVGAAFDYIAGTVKRPPLWMQRAGLEWLGRLVAEPRRLWKRYLVTNTIFIGYIIRELLGLNRHHSQCRPPE